MTDFLRAFSIFSTNVVIFFCICRRIFSYFRTFGLFELIINRLLNHKFCDHYFLTLRCKKAERFEKLLGFARSHFIVTRGSGILRLPPHDVLPAFLNLKGIINLALILHLES